MDKIIQGIRHFQDTVFPKNKALFQHLAASQSPETLVIACSDSRISLDLLTQTSPGDLFVCRNAGNIVPPQGRSNAVSASIEYALNALPIKDIVICGHSDCGAMKGLLHPKALRNMPQVRGWLTHSAGALEAFERHGGTPDGPGAVAALAKMNVRLQLEHLRTFPSVFSRVQEGSLRLHGWFYQIEVGDVEQCQGDGSWIPLRHPVPYQVPLMASAGSGRLRMLDVQIAPPATPAAADAQPLLGRLKYYLNPYDGRYEDLFKGSLGLNILRDFMAGLIVAMVAIPLAMGFAMASGLRPEQGIAGGAVAGMVGALWGGSKYQVYGPTAAFIPVIAGLMAKYNHSMLVLASVISGIILVFFGIARLGKIVAKVPHSIVVGFTIGIAFTIALSQVGEILGIKSKMPTHFFEKIGVISDNLGQINPYAIIIGLATFLMVKYILKVSVFIPAPLIALGVASLVSGTVWAGKGFSLIKDKYGSIPTDFFVFTPPAPLPVTAEALGDLVYYVVAIVLVAAIESLLCSRMADRLADNRGIPYNPNKELWGQGMVQIFIPLMNGFPHTGALARTATNIKLGAISPLAGIFKCILKLTLALFLARYLEMVPMACIGGILLYVSTAMVKPAEVKQVLAHNAFHISLMVYTAVVVVLTDFLIGVVTAIILWAVLYRFFDKPVEVQQTAAVQA